ncbi:hypothetical protein GCM10010315_11430 [Streptomyces luteosporeus]|uniref:Uncharacterized protein n=1 Tax=Streptomyces luteosporeus TaxID=173856 RepID=A0ABP6G132_9ACTN
MGTAEDELPCEQAKRKRDPQEQAIRTARARKVSARVPQARIGRWSLVTHTRSPQSRPPRRTLRTKKAGTAGR